MRDGLLVIGWFFAMILAAVGASRSLGIELIWWSLILVAVSAAVLGWLRPDQYKGADAALRFAKSRPFAVAYLLGVLMVGGILGRAVRGFPAQPSRDTISTPIRAKTSAEPVVAAPLAAPAPVDPFATMTDQQHMDAAKKALAENDAVFAEKHLDALPEALKASKPVIALRKRVTATMDRNRNAAEKALRDALRSERVTVAQKFDALFIKRGIEVESVQAVGADKTTLRIRYALCGRVFMDRVMGMIRDIDHFDRFGFARLECVGSFESYWQEL